MSGEDGGGTLGRDAVEISDGDRARIAEAVALWQNLNEQAEIELEPDPSKLADMI